MEERVGGGDKVSNSCNIPNSVGGNSWEMHQTQNRPIWMCLHI